MAAARRQACRGSRHTLITCNDAPLLRNGIIRKTDRFAIVFRRERRPKLDNLLNALRGPAERWLHQYQSITDIAGPQFHLPGK